MGGCVTNYRQYLCSTSSKSEENILEGGVYLCDVRNFSASL